MMYALLPDRPVQSNTAYIYLGYLCTNRICALIAAWLNAS